MRSRNVVVFALAGSLLFMVTVFTWKLDTGTVDRWYGKNGKENREHIKSMEIFMRDLHGYEIPEWKDE